MTYKPIQRIEWKYVKYVCIRCTSQKKKTLALSFVPLCCALAFTPIRTSSRPLQRMQIASGACASSPPYLPAIPTSVPGAAMLTPSYTADLICRLRELEADRQRIELSQALLQGEVRAFSHEVARGEQLFRRLSFLAELELMSASTVQPRRTTRPSWASSRPRREPCSRPSHLSPRPSSRPSTAATSSSGRSTRTSSCLRAFPTSPSARRSARRTPTSPHRPSLLSSTFPISPSPTPSCPSR